MNTNVSRNRSVLMGRNLEAKNWYTRAKCCVDFKKEVRKFSKNRNGIPEMEWIPKTRNLESKNFPKLILTLFTLSVPNCYMTRKVKWKALRNTENNKLRWIWFHYWVSKPKKHESLNFTEIFCLNQFLKYTWEIAQTFCMWRNTKRSGRETSYECWNKIWNP